jgi:hypothetical protein
MAGIQQRSRPVEILARRTRAWLSRHLGLGNRPRAAATSPGIGDCSNRRIRFGPSSPNYSQHDPFSAFSEIVDMIYDVLSQAIRDVPQMRIVSSRRCRVIIVAFLEDHRTSFVVQVQTTLNGKRHKASHPGRKWFRPDRSERVGNVGQPIVQLGNNLRIAPAAETLVKAPQAYRNLASCAE